jgi:hypothetical protein
LVFPDEYIEFGHLYGTGTFCSQRTHDILILNPFSPTYFDLIHDDEAIIAPFFSSDLTASQLARAGLLQHMMEPGLQACDEAAEELRRLGIKPSSLFPLGKDTDDAMLAWIVDPDPRRWRVLVQYSGREGHPFEVFNCGVSTFLADYFLSRLEVQGWKDRRIDGKTPHYWFARGGRFAAEQGI